MPPNKMERFTQHARRVLFMAQEEAEYLHHGSIGTEHLLLGLIRDEDSVGGRVLQTLGVEYAPVTKFVIELTATNPSQNSTPDLTPGTKQVLERAVDEARDLGHHFIGTEHLLLGLMRESEGLALTVLKRLDINPEDVRAEVLRVLQENPVQHAHATERPTEPLSQSLSQNRPPSFRACVSHPISDHSTPKTYAVIQTTITRILDMVEKQLLTTTQAAELLVALQPYLEPSTGQKVQLVAQALNSTNVANRRLHLAIRNITTREILFEITMPFQDAMNNLDRFLNTAIGDYRGWFWSEDINANSRIEFRIEQGEP